MFATDKGTENASLFIVFALLCTINLVAVFHSFRITPFWDLSVYIRGVNDYSLGITPYRIDSEFTFIYHPYVLRFFSFINEFFPLHWALIVSYVLSTCYFLYEISLIARRHFPDLAKTPLLPVALACALTYGGIGPAAVLSGNLSVFMGFTLVAVLMSAIRVRSSALVLLFLFTVSACSLVKPFFLAYLLALFIFLPARRALAFSSLVIASVSLAWISAGWLSSSEYASFLLALRHSTLDKKDLGIGLFGMVQPLIGSTTIAAAIHFSAMGAFLYACYFGIPRLMELKNSETLRLLVLVPAIVLLNPRLKEYDLPVATACLFLFLCIVLRQRTYFILAAGMFFLAPVSLIKAAKKLEVADGNVLDHLLSVMRMESASDANCLLLPGLVLILLLAVSQYTRIRPGLANNSARDKDLIGPALPAVSTVETTSAG